MKHHGGEEKKVGPRMLKREGINQRMRCETTSENAGSSLVRTCTSAGVNKSGSGSTPRYTATQSSLITKNTDAHRHSRSSTQRVVLAMPPMLISRLPHYRHPRA